MLLGNGLIFLANELIWLGDEVMFPANELTMLEDDVIFDLYELIFEKMRLNPALVETGRSC